MRFAKGRSTRLLLTFFGAWVLAFGFAGSAHSAEKVSLQNWWVFTPNVAAFFTALEKGYYKEAGLEVEFIEGRGSSLSVQRVAAGNNDFAVCDLGTAALAISRGVPIKGVAAFNQKSPMGVISRAESKIGGPKDLEGKRLGASPADAGKMIFPALASVNGVNVSRINMISVEPASRQKVLLAGEVDAIIAYFDNNVPELKAKGANITFFRYSDFKVNVLGGGIIVQEKTIDERPDTVRRFARASMKGFGRALENPEETVSFAMKRAPLSIPRRDVALETLQSTLALLHTERTQGKPLGWMAKEDWEDSIRLLSQYGGLKNPLPADRYYTNRFIE
ncbi:MAG: ABC transporter substrate-binding protein [Candidatus Tectomicrobia bacterium]|nr:ABC transporter substrate-binding protein [Candidatus Tectomicrobia bacterium]